MLTDKATIKIEVTSKLILMIPYNYKLIFFANSLKKLFKHHI